MNPTVELKHRFSIDNDNTLYLWIIEYGITHESLTFALHKGIFPKRIEVQCSGCKYFSGKFKGGPYSFELIEEYMENEQGIFIRDNKSELTLWIQKIHKITLIHGGY